MNIVVEKQPKCIASLRVEIPADKVKGQRDQIAQKFASKARVPGFRPGKAPRAVIEKRFEKEITEELNETLVSEAYDEALKQEDLKVLEFGAPQNLAHQADGSISFIANITLAPEVKLPDYKSVDVTVPMPEVPEEDILEQLTGLQERFAEFNDIEGRPAAMADFAVIDYSSTVDGTPTEEFLGKPAGHLSGREDYWVRLDEKAFLPGFAEKLVGMNSGESREVTLTMPEDFPVENLRNRDITFSTTLKELKQAVLPELDDALAERLAPGKTFDEIKELIRENMQSERKRKIDDMKVNQIVGHFTSQADFDLPDELIAQETQSQADAMVNRGVQAGMSEDEIQSQQAEIFATAGEQALNNLRSNFILQEIARAEEITVTDAEMINHLAQIAQSRKIAPKKFIKDMQREGRLQSIRSSIAVGKTIDFLVENANVVESAEASLEQ